MNKKCQQKKNSSKVNKIVLNTKGRFLGRIYAAVVIGYAIAFFLMSAGAKNFYSNRPSYGIVHCNMGNWNWMLTAHILIFGFIYLVVLSLN